MDSNETRIFTNESTVHHSDIEVVTFALITYIPPVIIVFGTSGNLVTFIVLRTKTFRKTSVGFVLSALMIVDTLALAVGITEWLPFIDPSLSFKHFSEMGCVMAAFFFHFFLHTSAWSLALLTAERLVMVVSPMKGRQFCSRRRMIAAWCIVVLVTALLNSHVIWTKSLYYVRYGHNIDNVTYWGPEHKWCTVRQQYAETWPEIWNWVNFFFLSILPSAFLFFANIVILLKLERARQLRRQISNQTSTDRRTFNSTTIMLFTASTTFLVLTGPFVIVMNVENYSNIKSREERDRFNLVVLIALLMLFLNSAINFLLYCVSGSQFRKAFKDLFRRCRSLNDPVQTTMRTFSVDALTQMRQ